MVFYHCKGLADYIIISLIGVVIDENARIQSALRHINSILIGNGKSLSDYPSLPQLENDDLPAVENNLIMQELRYDKVNLADQAANLIISLNADQLCIYQKVKAAVESNVGGFFLSMDMAVRGKHSYGMLLLPP